MALPPGRYAITWGADNTNVGRMAADEPDNRDPKPVMVGPGTATLWVVGGMPDNRRVLATRNTLVGGIDGLLFGFLQNPPNAPDWDIVALDGHFQVVLAGTNIVWTVPAGAPPGQITLAENVGGAGQLSMAGRGGDRLHRDQNSPEAEFSLVRPSVHQQDV
ncbi:hypothetical protein P691DRAFT_847546 [Macrolepiota fuliginosa MF-IS2]|uniref:Uncharacterized protein n=1 Tax=Macrolepiota fuliginosa MF-IS2 TaxID=1400762 RepID=A0A9P5X0X3_9AGAR|nr:hypothetical protein P691DRAFT_847546 [Macrolepiota fuliginosa MF-IS2]